MLAVLDIGMGNLHSVVNAINYLGHNAKIVTNADDLVSATKIILPGVGSFQRAADNMRQKEIDKAIINRVTVEGIPFLGICLGMQLLGTYGTEGGGTEGLGLVDAHVEHFRVDPGANGSIKVPHVGFNTVCATRESILLKGLGTHVDFYFTHSYRMTNTESPETVGVCTHGEQFVAALESPPIFGVQFHPEKSQTNGLALLKNFMEKT